MADPTIAILTPTRNKPTAEYNYAIQHNTPPHRLLTVVGHPVDEARNELVRQVLCLDRRPQFCVWIDDDAFWLPGTIERLIADAKRLPKPSMIVPWCGRRGITEYGYAARFVNEAERIVEPVRRRAQFMTAPEIQQADFVSQHFALHHTALLTKVGQEPFSIPEGGRLEEDLQFHDRVHAAGLRIYCDSTLPVWHVGRALVDGAVTSVGYLAGERPARIVDGHPKPIASGGIPLDTAAHDRSYGRAVDTVRTLDAPLVLVNADASVRAIGAIAVEFPTRVRGVGTSCMAPVTPRIAPAIG